MGNAADMERTLILVKPDGVQRGLIGEVISRFEKRGFKIVGLKMMHVTRELAEKHYEVHKGKPFYDSLVDFIIQAPLVAMAVQGRNVVPVSRAMIGALNPEDATSGSIRGDYAMSKAYNVIHGSDSPDNGDRETKLFFKADEMFDYPREIENWMKHDG